jgi:serine protease Do
LSTTIPEKPRKKVAMKKVNVSILIILLFSLALSGCGPVLTSLILPDNNQAVVLPVQSEAAQDEDSNLETPAVQSVNAESVVSQIPVDQAFTAVLAMQGVFEQVYEQVNPAVVNIQVRSGSMGSSSAFPSGATGSLGSGFVFDDQGHIVTNNHVVENANQILVTFDDGETFEAELIGTDPNADLAVVKVNVPSGRLHPLALADSRQVKVGQMAIAIGNPFGLAGTMTTGIVSALSRSLPVDSQGTATGGSYTIPDIIQTDAAINPGNSGGVLVNINGELIGIPTAIRTTTSGNSGIGFVIPANIVSRVVPTLIQTGTYDHPRMGISGITLTSEIAAQMDLEAAQKGVLVMSVSTGGPADQAGLRGSSTTGAMSQSAALTGDIIIAIDGQPVRRFDDLTSYLFNNTQVGQTVTLTILRQGQEQTVELILGVLPLP